MKICAAQLKPVKGNVIANIELHKKFIRLAVSQHADLIIFPELSLTGYEPALAKELAIDENDERLDDFQKLSDDNKITIGIGAPTKNRNGICISLIFFHPQQPRQVYSKKYLHADEEPFFISGENSSVLLNNKSNVALAICYELSIPQHAENAFKLGANVYAVSVAKSANGIEKAVDSLSAIAAEYSMTVLMSNCIGYCDNFESAGKTSAWNKKGCLTAQLSETDEGIVITDTETQNVFQKII